MTTAAETVIAAMPQLKTWIGRTRTIEDEIGVSAVRRVAAMLDHPIDNFSAGSHLPLHWFPMFCVDMARQRDIGPDGHPNKAVFLPPIPLPRRMGAGRRVSINAPLIAGQPAIKTVEVAAITPKQARTGQIVILTMRHTYHSNGELLAVDEFDAIYREAVQSGQTSAAPVAKPAPIDEQWSESATLDSTLVFRYSSVTWNAHRIHYDADYARESEGYPNTVQNGGLTMTLVLEAAMRNTDRRLVAYTARLTRPIFVGDTVRIAGRMSDTGMSCWVADANGALCAQLELELTA